MLFQAYKTLINLQNTNLDMFNESWQISVPPLKVQNWKVQKVDLTKTRGVITQIHMNLCFYPSLMMRYDKFIWLTDLSNLSK